MACRLHEENNRAHFMTRRYDRPDESHKIHAATLCGIAHFDYNHAGAYSYEQAIDVARKMNLTQFEIEQLYIRALFNILAQNNDDHTKNIGFVWQPMVNGISLQLTISVMLTERTQDGSASTK